MKTCKTCKHWKTRYSLGLGRCHNIPLFWEATEWDEKGEARKFLDQYKDTKAFAQDGSDYSAYLLTKPDFGCVSHEDA